MLLRLEFLVLWFNLVHIDILSLFGLEFFGLMSCDSIWIYKLAFIVLLQKLDSSGSIALILCTWMCCNSNNSDSIKWSERLILELLTNGPWNKISTRSDTPLEVLSKTLFRNISFEAYLYCAKDIWEWTWTFGYRSKKNEDLMCWSIRKEKEIVGRILVMGGHEDGHEVL